MTYGSSPRCGELDKVLTGLMDAKNGGAERDALRKNLLEMSTCFDADEHPAAAIMLAAALPQLRDYGASWIAARMLKDFAVRQNTHGDTADVCFAALAGFLDRTKDAGCKYMTSDLLADIALSNASFSVPAVMSIVRALDGENDHYAQSSMRNAIVKIGENCGEAAAATAVEGLSKILAGKGAGTETVRLVKAISSLGMAYATLSAPAADTLKAYVQAGVADAVLSRVLANEIADLAFANPATVGSAVKTLTAAFESASKHEQQVSYSLALSSIAVDHPAAVLTSLEDTLSKNLSEGHNRMAILAIANLAKDAPETADLCAQILTSHLPRETAGFNRRHIAKSLLECGREGAEKTNAITAINRALETEQDVDTRKEFLDTLRRFGYNRPFLGGNVVEFGR